MIKLFKW